MKRLVSTDNTDCNAIVPIIGLDGIGKSALARSIVHYAADRKYFTGGIIIVQINTVRNTFEMIKSFRDIVMSFLKLSKEEK